MRGRRWLPVALVSIALVVAWLGPASLHPTTRALGDPASEAPRHLWSLWLVADGLWAHGPLVRHAEGLAWPVGFTAHLMDPVNLTLFLPGYWASGGGASGAVLGWNLVHAGWLALSATGAAALAWTVGVRSPWALALAAATFGASPFLAGHPLTGRTELLPAGLWAWHLVLLLRYLRGGGRAWGVGAGALLGLAASGGAYLAVFLGLLEVPLALWLASPWGREGGVPRGAVLRSLALVAAVAALVVAPPVVALVLHPPPDLPSLATARMPLVADPGSPVPTLVRLARPPLDGLVDPPVYLGMVALPLAALGAWWRPRRALPWLALALVAAVLGLGTAISLVGLDVAAPAWWLAWGIPPLRHVSAWSRIGCLLALPLGVAAALGAEALAGRVRSPGLGSALLVALVALVVADQATWPRPWTWERPTFEVAVPRSLEVQLAKVPEGAIIELPAQLGLEGVALEVGFYDLWQLQHGRVLSASPDGVLDRAVVESALVRFAIHRQLHALHPDAATWDPPLPGGLGLDADQRACAVRDVRHLRTLGFSAVVVHRDRAAGPEVAALVEGALGRPPMDDGRVATWDLTRLRTAVEPRCPLPALVPEIQGRLDLEVSPGAPRGR